MLDKRGALQPELQSTPFCFVLDATKAEQERIIYEEKYFYRWMR